MDKLELYDSMEFRKYTTRSEMDKILNTLCGILEGLTLDSRINHKELDELIYWSNYYRKYNHLHPFNELIPILDNALRDYYLSKEEYDNIYWLVANLKGSNEYYDLLSSSMQELQGVLHGVLADNVINDIEIRQLRNWLDENDHLKGTYPYDEIDSLLMSILADGRISDEEKAILKAFLGDFIDTSRSLNINKQELNELKSQYNVRGICAACPEISFDSSSFCLTGASIRAPRNVIRKLLENVGGKFNDNVTLNTDYLVVGADGNPCWVFSCYGRKVETAIKMRKKGHKISIIHENDFWDEFIPYANGLKIDCESYLK